MEEQSPGGVLLQLYEKETLAQVFSCEFSEISKNTFFYRTPLDECSYTGQEPQKSFQT